MGKPKRPSKYRAGQEPVPGYRLVGFLGEGAFGEVWEAGGPGDVRQALKFINLSGKEGRKEFRALRMVRDVVHPNLIPITAMWLLDEDDRVLPDTWGREGRGGVPPGEKLTLVVAMGLGERDLSKRLAECRAAKLRGIPREELLGYMVSAAKAIDFLNMPIHDRDGVKVAIHHCDIKPHNIMIVGGAARVCDFGLAKVTTPDLESLSKSMIGGGGFSPAYAAPEALRGCEPGPWTDQYSLAVTYYELRTGELPFPHNADFAYVRKAHLEGTLDLSRMEKHPEELAVLRRALATRAEDRWPTAVEFVRALREAHPKPILVLKPGLLVGQGRQLQSRRACDGPTAEWLVLGPDRRESRLQTLDLQGLPPEGADLPALRACLAAGDSFGLSSEHFWGLQPDGVPLRYEVFAAAEKGTAAVLVIAFSGTPHPTLAEFLRFRRKPPTPTEIVRLLEPLADPLDRLHRGQGVAAVKAPPVQLLDLSPWTLRVGGKGEVVRAMPGGFFRARRTTSEKSEPLRPEFVPRNPCLAPEVPNGHISPAADQYSLAMIYLRLRAAAAGDVSLLAEPPADEAWASFHARLRMPPAFPPAIARDSAEHRVLTQALAPDPQRRFACVRVFLASLAKAVDEGRIFEESVQAERSWNGRRVAANAQEELTKSLVPPQLGGEDDDEPVPPMPTRNHPLPGRPEPCAAPVPRPPDDPIAAPMPGATAPGAVHHGPAWLGGLKVGHEIFPDCRLIRRLGCGAQSDQPTEIFEAGDRSGRARVVVGMRQLPDPPVGSVDGSALQQLKELTDRPAFLGNIRVHWLLDAEFRSIPPGDTERSLSDGRARWSAIGYRASSRTLADRAEQQRSQGWGLSRREVLQLLRQTATALDRLAKPTFRLGDRQASLAHLDVQPIHILLDAELSTRLIGFGCLRLIPGNYVHIPAGWGESTFFTAPELRRGIATIRSDQFSLAAMYVCLRLGLDWRKDEVRLQSPVWWSQMLPTAEQSMVLPGLQEHPQQRLADCTMLLDRLSAAEHFPGAQDILPIPQHVLNSLRQPAGQAISHPDPPQTCGFGLPLPAPPQPQFRAPPQPTPAAYPQAPSAYAQAGPTHFPQSQGYAPPAGSPQPPSPQGFPPQNHAPQAGYPLQQHPQGAHPPQSYAQQPQAGYPHPQGAHPPQSYAQQPQAGYPHPQGAHPPQSYAQHPQAGYPYPQSQANGGYPPGPAYPQPQQPPAYPQHPQAASYPGYGGPPAPSGSSILNRPALPPPPGSSILGRPKLPAPGSGILGRPPLPAGPTQPSNGYPAMPWSAGPGGEVGPQAAVSTLTGSEGHGPTPSVAAANVYPRPPDPRPPHAT